MKTRASAFLVLSLLMAITLSFVQDATRTRQPDTDDTAVERYLHQAQEHGVVLPESDTSSGWFSSATFIGVALTGLVMYRLVRRK